MRETRHDVRPLGPAAGAASVLLGPEDERISVLVLSSMGRDLASLVSILGRTRWHVFWFTSASDALMEMSRTPVPVVICDGEMPQGAWRRILRHSMTMPFPPRVIVTSALGQERFWAEVLNWGGYDVLAKPYEAGEIYRVVSAAYRSWTAERGRGAAWAMGA